MRVLLTGAAGSIGRVLCARLDHELVGVDIVEPPEEYDAARVIGWVIADVTDPAAVEAAVAEHRPDAVIHLAGIPTEASLPDELSSHVVTTAALLDAMVAQDVCRIVFASSNHAVGRTPRTELLSIETRPRPDTFYGVGKVAAEALLSVYADRYEIEAVCSRIGSFLPAPTTRRHLSTWLSHGDAVRMFETALTTPDPRFAVFYGISANTRAWWDLAPGRRLGYHPQDDAESWAEQIEAVPETDIDAAESAFVGGEYATPLFHRPAL
ncbi:MAG: NAD(P)-dependent oxidoreductase [Actinomycetota bacterium]|nr:NAD(P)-dependent oxidoreductase [Actinomycetota bacterium]